MQWGAVCVSFFACTTRALQELVSILFVFYGTYRVNSFPVLWASGVGAALLLIRPPGAARHASQDGTDLHGDVAPSVRYFLIRTLELGASDDPHVLW